MKKQNQLTIYWSFLKHKDWNIYMAATSDGLCYAGPNNHDFEELAVWAAKHFRESELIENNDKLYPYAAEFIEYFEGNRKQFIIPLELKGTKFQRDVWMALCEIPYGETWTYSDIANKINKPAAVRAVGTAIGANPALIIVPCHRVIGKNGTLTGYRGGLKMKTQLLELEKSFL